MFLAVPSAYRYCTPIHPNMYVLYLSDQVQCPSSPYVKAPLPLHHDRHCRPVRVSPNIYKAKSKKHPSQILFGKLNAFAWFPTHRCRVRQVRSENHDEYTVIYDTLWLETSLRYPNKSKCAIGGATRTRETRVRSYRCRYRSIQLCA